MTRKLLSRDVARQATYFKKKLVDVTELGEMPADGTSPEPTYVFVTEVSAAVRDKIEESFVIRKKSGRTITNLEGMRARIAVQCCVDEQGHRVFSDDDAEWLSTKSAAALSRIYNAYNELNGIGEEDREELEKNLPTEP